MVESAFDRGVVLIEPPENRAEPSLPFFLGSRFLYADGGFGGSGLGRLGGALHEGPTGAESAFRPPGWYSDRVARPLPGQNAIIA